MRTSPQTQREYSERQAREYADNFDLEGFGYPVLSHRDGVWYIVDGQHRIQALRLMGWNDQQIECEVYEGMSEEEEAELFLKRNHRRAVRSFDKFKVAVAAGRPAPSEINRIVMALGLKVSEDSTDGSVSAVVTLGRVYTGYGASTLAKTLRIARDSWGKDREGFRGELLMGLGHVCGRFNGQVDEQEAVAHLAKVSGGALGLLGKAQSQRRLTGETLPRCVAAVVVDVLNAGRPRNHKLPSWWESDKEETANGK